MLPLLLLLSCRGEPLLLQADERLVGEGLLGQLRIEPGAPWSADRLLVTLYGPGLATDGEVTAVAQAEEEGLVWVYFPLRTALGEGEAALRLQGREAMLPLGARPGEHALRLRREAGLADAGALAQARTQAEEALQRSADAWALGAFRLEDPALRAAGRDPLVGELWFRGDQPPVVAVYDLLWWTGAPVPADRYDDGPDIVLAFPVEPALQGEEALLRVNAPTGVAVVPADRVPTDLDRRLDLVAGTVSNAERAAAMERARNAADAAEREALASIGAQLARAVTRDGACLDWKEALPAAADLVVGYRVDIVRQGDRCIVEVEPTVPQHRRRLALRIGAEGVLPDHE